MPIFPISIRGLQYQCCRIARSSGSFSSSLVLMTLLCLRQKINFVSRQTRKIDWHVLVFQMIHNSFACVSLVTVRTTYRQECGAPNRRFAGEDFFIECRASDSKTMAHIMSQLRYESFSKPLWSIQYCIPEVAIA